MNRFGEGDGVKWLDGVLCDGTEERLDQCRHDPWGEAFCEQEAVSVSCSVGEPFLLQFTIFFIFFNQHHSCVSINT